MDNGKKFLSDVDVLRKAIETRKLVVFVGSGVSMNSGLPNWNTLLQELKNDIGIESSDTEDSLQIAQIYFNERKHKEYIEKIRDILYHKKKKYNSINEAIFDLQPEHVITTNYDDLLEQVIKNRALPFSIIKKDTEFPYAVNSNLLVKIHGDLDNDDFVLKEEDYLEYEYKHPLFEAFIKSIFSTKVVLFIGYSYSDYNLKNILQKVRNILGKNYQSSYLLTHESFSSYKINYLRDKGVNVISYEDNKKTIDSYLAGENAKNIFYKKESNLSKEEGENLLDLITFITAHDRFKEGLNELNYIDQMSKSLTRFSELNSLPYFFVGNLYPFNVKNNEIYYSDYNIYSLNTNNSNLFDFLSDNIFYKDGKTSLSHEYVSVINNEKELERLEKELKYVISILNDSAITVFSLNFHERKDVNDENYKDVVVFNKYDYKNEYLGDMFDRFELAKIIDRVQVSDITEASDVKSDILLAFSHYKCGNMYQAYNLFEETAQKAWHTGKYITYFIAKYNLKQIGIFVQRKEGNSLDIKQIDEIKNKAKKIDLDSVYRQISDVSKEESDLIKIIRDSDVLIRANTVVNAEYDIIKGLYKRLSEGGQDNERNSHSILEFNLIAVALFYSKNCIIQDEFFRYKNFFNKGIEASMLNSVMYSKYSSEAIILDYNFCGYFIEYGDYSKLEKFVEEYDITRIKLDDDSLEKLYESIIHYFSSFLRKNASNAENYKMNYQISKAIYSHKFTDFFKNISLLLRLVDLNAEKTNKVGEMIINVITNTNIFIPQTVHSLKHYLYGCKDKLEINFLEKMLDVIYKKTKYISLEILGNIAQILSDKSSENRISNEQLINRIIAVIKSDSLNGRKKEMSLYYLWNCVNDENRIKVKDEIVIALEGHFYEWLYWTSVMNGVIDYQAFFSKYLQRVINLPSSGKFFEVEYGLRGKSNVVSGSFNSNIIDFVRMLYKLNMVNNDAIVKSFENHDNYVKFYISSYTFDYELFDIKWLLYTYDSNIHRELSSISEVKDRLSAYLRENKDKEFFDLYLMYYI